MKTGILISIFLLLFFSSTFSYGSEILNTPEKETTLQKNNSNKHDFANEERWLPINIVGLNFMALGERETESSESGTLLLLITGLVAVAFVAGYSLNKRKRKAKNVNGNTKVFNERILSFPGDLYFDKSHTWVSKEKDGRVKIGIDDFLQHVTGDYTRLKMKNPEELVVRNEPVLTLLQKGKKISIKAPISGKIKEFNNDLLAFPSIINNSPYSWGWIYIIEPTNWLSEIELLSVAKSYKAWIKKEISRLKDFIARVNLNDAVSEEVIYQEGGELTDNVLEEFGKDVWEDFQKEFLD